MARTINYKQLKKNIPPTQGMNNPSMAGPSRPQSAIEPPSRPTPRSSMATGMQPPSDIAPQNTIPPQGGIPRAAATNIAPLPPSNTGALPSNIGDASSQKVTGIGPPQLANADSRGVTGVGTPQLTNVNAQGFTGIGPPQLTSADTQGFTGVGTPQLTNVDASGYTGVGPPRLTNADSRGVTGLGLPQLRNASSRGVASTSLPPVQKTPEEIYRQSILDRAKSDPQTASDLRVLERESALRLEKAKRDAHNRAIQNGYRPGSVEYNAAMRDAHTLATNENLSQQNLLAQRSQQRQETNLDRLRDFGNETYQRGLTEKVFNYQAGQDIQTQQNNVRNFMSNEARQDKLAVERGEIRQDEADERAKLREERLRSFNNTVKIDQRNYNYKAGQDILARVERGEVRISDISERDKDRAINASIRDYERKYVEGRNTLQDRLNVIDNMLRFASSAKAKELITMQAATGISVADIMKNILDKDGNWPKDETALQRAEKEFKDRINTMDVDPNGEKWEDGEWGSKENYASKTWSQLQSQILNPIRTQDKTIKAKIEAKSRIDNFLKTGDTKGVNAKDFAYLETSLGTTDLQDAIDDERITETQGGPGKDDWDYMENISKKDATAKWKERNPVSNMPVGSVIVKDGKIYILTKPFVIDSTGGDNSKIRVYGTDVNGNEVVIYQSSEFEKPW